MDIQKNYSLINENTFKFHVSADFFLRVTSEELLMQALLFSKNNNIPYLIIGGGSNLLLSRNFKGLVIQMKISGIKKISETDTYIVLSVGAGEIWKNFVDYCVSHNYFGIENLTHIPGTVGAAPIQNIGAYGVEIKDVFVELTAVDVYTLKEKKFQLSECQFSYRQSIFKKELKDKYIITRVVLQLLKIPKLILTDKMLNQELHANHMKTLTPLLVKQTIEKIRASRLPDCQLIGNVGSYFLNPYITYDQYHDIKTKYDNLIAYPIDSNTFKISAGWLIDKCGWHGYRKDEYGVYQHNPLVLVNYGNATASQILKLGDQIRETVQKKFDIHLEMEPRVY